MHLCRHKWREKTPYGKVFSSLVLYLAVHCLCIKVTMFIMFWTFVVWGHVLLISCCIVFVSTLAKRLTRKTTCVIYFVAKGFPYKDQIEIEELFIVMVSYCVFQTLNIFIKFNFNCNVPLDIVCFVLRVLLNPSQSVNLLL